MNLAEDGVELWRQCLPSDTLRYTVKEYERSEPETHDVPKHVPIVVYRTHTHGNMRRIQLLSKMPRMKELAQFVALLLHKKLVGEQRLRLLETVIFNKPPLTSGVLHWHQDVSYFALKPNDQLAVWIPFDKVTRQSGAMQYILGSHLFGMVASKDLHTNELLDPADQRPSISAEGQIVACMEMLPGDMLVHSGYTWHMSGANEVPGQPRRGLSLRFIVGDVTYDPRPGAAAPFLKQINDLAAGQAVEDPAFPEL